MQYKQSNMIIFTTDDNNVELNVKLENETVWLTQAQMSELFGKARSTITEHIKNVFVEGELDEEVVCRNFRQPLNTVLLKAKPNKGTLSTTTLTSSFQWVIG